MDIKPGLAAAGYAAARDTTRPASGEATGAALRAAGDFAKTLAEGDAAARAAMTGRADSHALVTALAEAELAVSTAVTVRNKVVEAYQEILRMPV